jgi:hypothetical protein
MAPDLTPEAGGTEGAVRTLEEMALRLEWAVGALRTIAGTAKDDAGALAQAGLDLATADEDALSAAGNEEALTSLREARASRERAAFAASEASGYYAPGELDADHRRAFEDGAAFALTGAFPVSPPQPAAVKEALGALRAARKTMRNTWGAVGSGQVHDKDVFGQLERGWRAADKALSDLERSR